ncbi:MAG: hypothetical protein DCC75_10415 [Proteobacteria bacterium]|nr:MAG: hypothetical protein DCC75_10415 [Pseudomonadota bacterium]
MELESVNFSYWILQTAAMLLTCLLIPRLTVTGPISALITVLVMGFINAHLWNTALFFNIPDTLTLQVAVIFIVNGLIFWTVVKILPGISVQGFLPALIAPIVFTFCSMMIDRYASQVDWVALFKTIKQTASQLRSHLEDTPAQKNFLKHDPAPDTDE